MLEEEEDPGSTSDPGTYRLVMVDFCNLYLYKIFVIYKNIFYNLICVWKNSVEKYIKLIASQSV